MKLKLFSALISLSLLASVSACQHSNDVKPNTDLNATSVSTKNGKVLFTDGTQAELNGAIRVVKQSQDLLSKLSLGAQNATPYNDFDMSKVIAAQVSGMTDKAYVFKEIKSVGDKQKVLAVYNYGRPDARVVVIETSAQAVEYIDYVNGYEIVVTQEQGVIKVKNVSLDNQRGMNKPSGCGDAVAACIADAYANHGWISVWAFVQTAFIPVTAAAIAADCAFHNC